MHGFRDFALTLPETRDVHITTGFEDAMVLAPA